VPADRPPRPPPVVTDATPARADGVPGGDSEGGDGDAPDGRPPVFVPGGPHSITEAAAALGRLLAATGRYFLWGGVACSLDVHAADGADGTATPVLTPARPATLASAFEAVARPRAVRRIGGRDVAADGVFGEPDAKLVAHADAFRDALPTVRLLSACPVLVARAGGGLVVVTGYDRQSGVLASGPAPAAVTAEEATYLLRGLLRDFAFATEADRSRALAALVTPALALGGLLPGRAPVDLGEADLSQTGKGYRNKLTAAVYGAAVRTVTQKRGGVGSLEESFHSHLLRGAPFVCFDNLRGRIDSPALESFLTEGRYLARVPFREPVEVDPRRVVVMMTSNKADLTPDLANRASCVRIRKRDPALPFHAYPEGDVLDHVRANQPLYLGAVFAVVRAWHAAGRPKTAEHRHDFRGWAQALDWIVRNLLGAAPLLDGHREAQVRMATPALNWLRDVALLVSAGGRAGQWLRAHDLLDLLAGADGDGDNGGDPRAAGRRRPGGRRAGPDGRAAVDRPAAGRLPGRRRRRRGRGRRRPPARGAGPGPAPHHQDVPVRGRA